MQTAPAFIPMPIEYEHTTDCIAWRAVLLLFCLFFFFYLFTLSSSFLTNFLLFFSSLSISTHRERVNTEILMLQKCTFSVQICIGVRIFMLLIEVRAYFYFFPYHSLLHSFFQIVFTFVCMCIDSNVIFDIFSPFDFRIKLT